MLGVGLLLAALAMPDPARALTVTDRSTGCGSAAPATPPSRLVVDGRARDFITVVPRGYRSDHPHALVLAFHGRTSPNTEVRQYYHLEDYGPADTIYVYPSGLRHPNGGFTWWDEGDPPEALRDFALFDALVATFERQYCIDRERIYAVGHSLGASFVNVLGCARGDVLRAIGTLAGGIFGSRCRGKVAAAIFHNPADRLVDFDLGLGVRNFYIAHNGDRAGPDLDQLQAFTCARYGSGDGLYPVVWCPLDRDYRHGRFYPHQWPADAGAAIMRFFDQLPESRPTAGRLIRAMVERKSGPEPKGVPFPTLRFRFVQPSPEKPSLLARQPEPKPGTAEVLAFQGHGGT
jgi:polyhydroxybutyrate depolymerase